MSKPPNPWAQMVDIHRQMDEWFRAPKTDRERVILLSRLLIGLAPQCTVLACRFGRPHVIEVSPANASTHRDIMRTFDGCTLDQSESSPLSAVLPELKALKITLLCEIVRVADKPWGFIGFVRDQSCPEDSNRAAQLSVCARILELRLSMSTQAQHAEKLQSEARDHALQGDMSEFVSFVVHRFNNFLNSLLLRVAIVERECPASAVESLGSIRLQAKKVVTTIGQLNQYRGMRAPDAQLLDVGELVAKSCEDFQKEVADGREFLTGHAAMHSAEGTSPLHVEVKASAESVFVKAVAVEMKRLMRFILRNSARALEPMFGRLEVRVVAFDNTVLIECENNGTGLTNEAAEQIFGDESESSPLHKLELIASATIAKRLRGHVAGHRTASGGLKIALELPRAK